jgi:hypothetical protein
VKAGGGDKIHSQNLLHSDTLERTEMTVTVIREVIIRNKTSMHTIPYVSARIFGSMRLLEDLCGIIGAEVLDSSSNTVVHLCLELDDSTLSACLACVTSMTSFIEKSASYQARLKMRDNTGQRF